MNDAESAARSDWDEEDTDVGLLQRMQESLRRRLHEAAPDSMAMWQETERQFCKFNSQLVRRFVLRCHVPLGDVEDCIQDVWCDVFQHLPQFVHSGHRRCFRRWLSLVVRSKATNHARRRQRQKAQSLPDDSRYGPTDQHAEPTDEFDRAWELEVFHTGVDQLREHVTPRTYQVFTMRVIEGRSVAETAQATELSPREVSARCSRAAAKLKEMLAIYTGTQIRVVD